MTLIKSISGIRGTIGGLPGESLTPLDIVKFTYAYCEKMKERRPKQDGERYKVVVGKDARLSGDMVEQLVCGTIVSCGVDVVKAGFASTPTTEMAVVFEEADGGIILTASHNPKQWNALKLLNEKGEFLCIEEFALFIKKLERIPLLWIMGRCKNDSSVSLLKDYRHLCGRSRRKTSPYHINATRNSRSTD